MKLNELKKSKVCIVIPTYNEAENISLLLREIFEFVDLENSRRDEERRAEVHALVVDDNSPDGTAGVVKKYMRKEKRVHLHFREEKQGLGAAYKSGMKHALKLLNPDIVFEMDADFSHNPKDLFRMIDAIREGNDFVIGSRYVEGGSVPNDWGIHRKFLSYSARTVTRVGLGLKGIKDCSGGFRAIRAEIIRSIDMDNLLGDGYGFQASFLEAVIRKGFRIKEIPINFGNRNRGTSKMSLSDVIEGWILVFKIKSMRIKEGFNKNGKQKVFAVKR